MVRGARRIVPAATVVVVAAGCLGLSYTWLPWRQVWLSFHLWTSLIVFAFAELTPIPTASSRFRFRLVAQLPLLLTFGCFPLLLAQTVLLAVVQWIQTVRRGSFVLYHPRILSGYLAPFVTAMVVEIWFRRAPGPALAANLPVLAVAAAVLWAFSFLLSRIPGPKAVVHPWHPIRGWSAVLVGLDALLTSAVLAQQTSGVMWAAWTANLEVTAVIGIIWIYTDSGIRRAGLSELAALLARAAAHPSLPEMLESLFEGLPRIAPVDAAVLWTAADDRTFRPSYWHAYGERGQRLIRKYTLRPPEVPMGLGLVGFAASSREVVMVNFPREKAMFDDWWIASEPNLCVLAAPVVVGDHVFGVLCLYYYSWATAYRRRERELFDLFSAHIGNLVAYLWRLEQTRLESERDDLTGLYNYRYFDRVLHDLIAASQATGQPVSLLIIDIDHFKRVNDRYGHLAGNQVLCALADVLRSMVREGDVVARYGGEEFTVLLPGLNLDEARLVAERIRTRTEEMQFEVEDTLQPGDPGRPDGNRRARRHRLRITLSIGVATYPDTADSALTLVRHADRAMYVGSKQRGRNRVSAYGP
ncbi:MAG: sensor domain-containing diguanylate cyclase [Alicyclobacillus sp.]|nr:sensor domain-containing diguanylate cyclase [Alicyclobacillus sp.]